MWACPRAQASRLADAAVCVREGGAPGPSELGTATVALASKQCVPSLASTLRAKDTRFARKGNTVDARREIISRARRVRVQTRYRRSGCRKLFCGQRRRTCSVARAEKARVGIGRLEVKDINWIEWAERASSSI
eukprot:2724220-Pleurochrysis_carterae.AAC.3